MDLSLRQSCDGVRGTSLGGRNIQHLNHSNLRGEDRSTAGGK
ncbi:hypothetical protein CYB_2207 [Synechococcus sp. JA-2-3B'a(2-13)]|nr:hypothetical protein [Synechococcus sp. JA-2-3B'a(2-13)]ABD03152.1 hypothetical protein CYB_2207 [Synechococcus sp. JA-2-3B'a(2-13)]